MSIAETLTLSGTNSFDPDGNKGGKQVSYQWQVVNMDGSAVISRSRNTRIKLGTTADISIPARGNFQLGTSYKFSLTYRVGGRVNTAEHVVNVIACAECIPPLVKITTTDKVVNPSSKVMVKAHIRSVNVTATYVWSIENVDEADAGNFIPFSFLFSNGDLCPLDVTRD